MSSAQYTLHAAAAIIIQNGKVLAERSRGKEFFSHPGGKLEAEEVAEEALIRELREELKIDVARADVRLFGTYYGTGANDPDEQMRMDVFMVEAWEGEITPSAEVEEILWLGSDVPSGVKIGSILQNNVIPQLSEEGLIK